MTPYDPSVPLPVVIDSDGGVDDAVALWWAVTHPEVEVVAVTVVWGNVPIDRATESILRVLDAAGRPDIPVAVGERVALGPAPPTRPASFIHGDDGLGNTVDVSAPFNGRPATETAAELLQRLTRARPGELTLVTIGPLSNVGRAVTEDTSFAGRVKDLVVMGGAARPQATPYRSARPTSRTTRSRPRPSSARRGGTHLCSWDSTSPTTPPSASASSSW